MAAARVSECDVCLFTFFSFHLQSQRSNCLMPSGLMSGSNRACRSRAFGDLPSKMMMNRMIGKGKNRRENVLDVHQWSRLIANELRLSALPLRGENAKSLHHIRCKAVGCEKSKEQTSENRKSATATGEQSQ